MGYPQQLEILFRKMTIFVSVRKKNNKEELFEWSTFIKTDYLWSNEMTLQPPSLMWNQNRKVAKVKERKKVYFERNLLVC